MRNLLLFLHLAGAIFWMGGMAFVVLALRLRRGDDRRRRAAGVVLATAVGSVGLAGAALANVASLGDQAVTLAGSIAAAIAAVIFRLVHRSLVTQAALLAALTTLAATSLRFLSSVVNPGPTFTPAGELIPAAGAPDPLVLVAVEAITWLAVGIVFGVIGLREARAAEVDAAAGRRAGLTRLWAGLTAVIGFALAVTRSEPGSEGPVRVIEPVIADALLLALAAILVGRGFRREANAFVYAAALAVIIALTDFNFSYLSSSTEVGLLIEGLILLAAGFAADRARATASTACRLAAGSRQTSIRERDWRAADRATASSDRRPCPASARRH